jgi:glutamate-1-semialdehyde 2,1-aminomutase
MKMILAHSARGFQPANNFEGLRPLTDLKNIYFDTSANCETFAHQCLISMFGPKRILFGTDFPICHFRGKSVSIGDSFVWLLEEDPTWSAGLQGINTLLVGMENLRSLKWACWTEGLSDRDIEDIFWNNACELFALR